MASPMVQLKQPPSARPPAANGKSAVPAEPREFKIQLGKVSGAHRDLIYGPGGIGKTNLAARSENPIFLDVEDGTRFIDVPRITGLHTFEDVRACLQSPVMDDYKTVVIDTVTKIEELAVDWTLRNIPNEKGRFVKRIEEYGYGKGYQHVYDTFLLFLQDCDVNIRAGRNVILIAHDCTADVPNPVGDDYIRYEPHLQSPKSGKASIRNRVIQWADYVLFVGYDVIAEDGKGKGGGTRTIFTVERPDHIAKSRTQIEPIAFNDPADGTIWKLIAEGGAK